ncbi:hypothetical protein CNMCM8980_005167 [Aspergillus fumigatiaffinis]|nr:hypothetical protein CNMCM8980_005167 [Aspergillus fumigatiaffinis]
MRRHRAPDPGLLADHHTLQHARVHEAQRLGDGGIARAQGDSLEGRRERVQCMSDLVDCLLFGLEESGVSRCGVGGGGEGVWFEEEADFVSGVQEVVVADVGVIFVGFVVAGGEFGEGVGF